LETECATFATMAERRLGIADRLVRCFPARRDSTRITHKLSGMIRARTFAISCGDEDADDLDFLRTDPAFKLACGKLPDTGSDCVRRRDLPGGGMLIRADGGLFRYDPTTRLVAPAGKEKTGFVRDMRDLPRGGSPFVNPRIVRNVAVECLWPKSHAV
jgi:hypothetical protein